MSTQSETAAVSARVTVSPGNPQARWQVRVPGSKSITNRALLLAGMAAGRSTLEHPLISDDTDAMAQALQVLGVTVTDRSVTERGMSESEQPRGGAEQGEGESERGLAWEIEGLGGPPHGSRDIYCGMGATVGRFLVPMLAAGQGHFRADAHPQLRRRPLAALLAALRAQGAVIEGDAFPLVIDAQGLDGGEVEIDASGSSQFLSGLLMAAPFARADVRLRFGALVSRPYLQLTLRAMCAFGVEADIAPDLISVAHGGYRGTRYAVEPDASTASYFLASAALTGTTVRLPGIDRRVSAQGDLELVEILGRMGCEVRDKSGLELTGPPRLRGVEVDMSDSSDVFMTLACVAALAEGPTTIEGIGHARAKESDRIAACAENLERLGIRVQQGHDWIRIHPGAPHPATLPTYEDHRIAMAFSLIGTRAPVTLEQPSVVSKTCPGFFELWRATGARIEFGDGAGGDREW